MNIIMNIFPDFSKDSILRTRVRTLLIIAVLVSIVAPAAAQSGNAVETMNFDQTMEIDELGQASITIRMTFTAAQFQQWQQKYGANKSLLKRDMNKFISQYETFDWDVSEKQMAREVTVSLKAKGAIVHKGRGIEEFRVPKEWRGGERRDNTFSFNYIEGIAPGVVGQFNVKLIAPQEAANFREQLSESGEKVIQYAMPVPDGRQGWMLIAGLITLVLGAGFVGASLLGGLSRTDPPARLESRLKASSPARPQHKSVDPPSMSTIPLEESNTGTFIDDRKASPRR